MTPYKYDSYNFTLQKGYRGKFMRRNSSFTVRERLTPAMACSTRTRTLGSVLGILQRFRGVPVFVIDAGFFRRYACSKAGRSKSNSSSVRPVNETIFLGLSLSSSYVSIHLS